MQRISLMAIILSSSLTLGAAPAENGTKEKSMAAPAAETSFLATKIVTAKPDEILKFYTEVIGMKNVGSHGEGHDEEVILKFEGGDGPLLMPLINPADRNITVGTAFGPLVFMTSDLSGMLARMRRAGTRITQQPKSYPQEGIEVVHALDPEGRAIEIVQVTQKAKPTN